MKKAILIVVGLFLFFSLVLAGGYLWWSYQISPVSSAAAPLVAFVIPRDQSSSVTIDELYSHHLIRNPLTAKIYLRFTHLDQKILPGSYVFAPNTTLPLIFRTLAAGPKDIWVTLPEGWRREQMAVRLHNTIPSIDPQQFIASTASLEGQLFPDTYLMPSLADSSVAVRILLNNFTAKTHLDPAALYQLELDNKTFSLTGRQVLTVASLVEREAKAETDRPMIAGILLRRFRADWPLQVDAALQYAEGSQRCQMAPLDCSYWQPISDTKVASVYNTYIHPGLPPAPIANPGLAVITAVLHPQTSPYWYYLTGTDGTTHYAKTLMEHNSNVDKYIKY